MNLDQFWNLIEQSRADTNDCDEQGAKLIELLAQLPPEEIKNFDLQFHALMAQSYRWDWWAVGYIVNGGCSDNGFEYFRAWVISQGRGYYEAALKDAARAGDNANPERDDWECEAVMYAGYIAHQQVTGQETYLEDHKTGLAYPPEPLGEPLDDDDLPKHFPDLCERFGYND